VAAPEDRITRSTVLTLVAMGLGVFILANDFSAINVALPTIERDLDTDLTSVQWVINAYGLVFGMLIVTGGGLADTLGRRRVFFAGAAIFAATSVLGGVAPSIEVLIASRALMGVGAALMWPAILGMTTRRCPRRRLDWPAG
jgi:MFS family permease